MSIAVMSHVWANSAQSGGRLLILLAMADFADDCGVCWPSVPRLSLKARMSERQVQRVLRELEDANEITTLKPGGIVEGVRKATVYKIMLRRQNVTPEQQGGDIEGQSRVTPASPQPSVEPSVSLFAGAREPDAGPRKKPVTYNRKKVPREQVAMAERILAHFAALTGTTQTPYTKAGDVREPLRQVIGAIRMNDEVPEQRWMTAVANTVKNPPSWVEGAVTVGDVFGPRAVLHALDNAGANGNGKGDHGTTGEVHPHAQRLVEEGVITAEQAVGMDGYEARRIRRKQEGW